MNRVFKKTSFLDLTDEVKKHNMMIKNASLDVDIWFYEVVLWRK